MSIGDVNYFSKGYKEARFRWLEAVNKIGASLGPQRFSHQELPLKNLGYGGKTNNDHIIEDGKTISEIGGPLLGKEKEPLFIDVAWIGSRKPKVVFFHSCGVHGVEGYAGSAIQLQALTNDKFTERLKALPNDVAVVLIHAVNPYGMSHLRRWNESNVDLNRNLLADEQFPVYKENSLKTKGTYDQLKAVITPSAEPWSWNLNIAVTSAYYILIYGYETLKGIIAGGQYHTQDGLFYCGDKTEQSHKLLCSYLVENFSEASHYVHIDVHTGLGSWGHDMLILEDKARSEEGFIEALGDHTVNTFGYNADGSLPQGLLRIFFPKDTAKPHRHEWLLSLDSADKLSKRVKSTKSFDGVTQEFGTYPGIQVFSSLRIENFYHHRASDPQYSYYHDWSKKNVLDTFSPEDAAWKKTVLTRGDWLFTRCLDYASKKSSDK